VISPVFVLIVNSGAEGLSECGKTVKVPPATPSIVGVALLLHKSLILYAIVAVPKFSFTGKGPAKSSKSDDGETEDFVLTKTEPNSPPKQGLMLVKSAVILMAASTNWYGW